MESVHLEYSLYLNVLVLSHEQSSWSEKSTSASSLRLTRE